MIRYTHLETPIGRLAVAEGASGLFEIRFPQDADPRPLPEDWRFEPRLEHGAEEQLLAYFAGELTTFELPLAHHGTPFQLRVWEAVRSIPYGETKSYGEIAKDIGGVARSVGTANGSNRLPIVIPCHRVVGFDGSMTGYAGGLDRKRRLLSLEGASRPLFR
jgi:methylated-DNA-[protein]-cysteine S-methyltransferase